MERTQLAGFFLLGIVLILISFLNFSHVLAQRGGNEELGNCKINDDCQSGLCNTDYGKQPYCIANPNHGSLYAVTLIPFILGIVIMYFSKGFLANLTIPISRIKSKQTPFNISNFRQPQYRQTQEKPDFHYGLAAVLSFFIPGLGHIYKGQITKGLLLLLFDIFVGIFAIMFGISGVLLGLLSGQAPIGIGSLVIAFILYFSVWLYALYDAYNH
ncbi:MAG: hypothetical protein V1835_05195 [Candidatus Micrarchaeota archaeon]